jgi:hypothetical protein
MTLPDPPPVPEVEKVTGTVVVPAVVVKVRLHVVPEASPLVEAVTVTV